MALRETTSIRQSVRAALRAHDRVVLAVSGGLDSMVLLDAAAATIPAPALLVATFDHGTGATAATAASFVERCATGRGIAVALGHAGRSFTTEAELRAARWTFLRSVAARVGGRVCTAHTQNDQIETVLMRTLRGSGARGLAGLFAEGDVLRPLLRFPRRDLTRYARAEGLAWIEDPSNDSPRFFRNRVRHDLLPALRRVAPTIDADLLAVSRRAARWRADMERLTDTVIGHAVRAVPRELDVASSPLTDYSDNALAVLWPVLIAKIGVAVDHRGTKRLAAFTQRGRVGSRIQLSGGWEVLRARTRFEVRHRGDTPPSSRSIGTTDVVTWGAWSFRPAVEAGAADPWTAWLPTDRPLRVRVWEAGDAMIVRPGSQARKVKRFLSDAGVTGGDRARWPVVLAGEQIIWIPGVRRGEAATERTGQPGLAFLCEYHHR